MRSPTPWLVPLTCLLLAAGFSARGLADPQADCSARETAIDRLICRQPELTALDRQLVETLGVARAADLDAGNAERARRLGEQQEAWKAELAGCLGDDYVDVANPIECVRNRYEQRVAQLQIEYAMVAELRQAVYRCDGDPEERLLATYFATDRPTVRLQRGERRVIAYLFRRRSGSEYLAKGGVSFRADGATATIEWPPDPPRRCAVVVPEGEEVDLVVEWGERVLPVEVKSSSRVRADHIRHLESFLREYPDLVPGALLLYDGDDTFWMREHILALPWWKVL